MKSQSALQILTASECTEVVGDPCILSVDPAAGSMGCLFLFGLNRGVSDAEVNSLTSLINLMQSRIRVLSH